MCELETWNNIKLSYDATILFTRKDGQKMPRSLPADLAGEVGYDEVAVIVQAQPRTDVYEVHQLAMDSA